MSVNNLISLALILYDFKNGNIIPGENVVVYGVEITGTIRGLENVKCMIISFQDDKIVINYKLNDIKHCLLLSSFEIQENMIRFEARDITGKIYCIDVLEIDELHLDNFKCKIIIPKCNWDSHKQTLIQ